MKIESITASFEVKFLLKAGDYGKTEHETAALSMTVTPEDGEVLSEDDVLARVRKATLMQTTRMKRKAERQEEIRYDGYSESGKEES